VRAKVTAVLLLLTLIALPVSAGKVRYDDVVTDIAKTFSEALGKKSRVAFVSIESDSEAFSSRFVSDVENALINRDSIVLERSNLDAMIKELEFQTSGLVDDNAAVSIGHMLGADLIIAASAQNMVSYYRVDIKLIDLATTLVKRKLSYDVSYDSKLREILKGQSEAVGSQRIGIGVKYGMAFGFNKAHVDMVGSGVTPKEESLAAKAPSITLSYKIVDLLSIRSGLNFMIDNGIDISGLGAGSDAVVTYSSMDIPLLLSFTAIEKPVRVDIFAGGYLSLPLSQVSITTSVGGASLDMNGRVWGVSGGVAIGYSVGPGYIGLDVRYGYDFNSFTVTVDDGSGPEEMGLMHRQNLTASLGYTFML